METKKKKTVLFIKRTELLEFIRVELLTEYTLAFCYYLFGLKKKYSVIKYYI